jgi:hypothetical protein
MPLTKVISGILVVCGTTMWALADFLSLPTLFFYKR